MRTSGHAACNTISKMGAFMSPFFVVSNVSRFGVGMTLGVLNLLAAISCFFLPETTGIFTTAKKSYYVKVILY